MDFSHMSDDELMGMYQKLKGGAQAGTSAGAPKMSVQDSKALQAMRDEADKSLNTATQAERFLAINKDVKTGGIGGIGPVAAVRGAFDPKFAELQGITSAVAPGLRPPGSGSSSDKDVKFYTRGFTNTEVPYETNKNTYDRLHSQSDRAAAHAAFVDKWAQARGSLLGSEPAFLQYWAGKAKAQAAPAQHTGVADGDTVDIFGRPVR